MDQSVQSFIDKKKLAIVGASRGGKKFGNSAAKELTERGYEVFLVHPEAETIDNFHCYPSLAELADEVDGVFVSVPAEQAKTVFKEAAEVGLHDLWLQQMADTPELIEYGEELDLNLVYGKCILMYAEPVRGFHNFHRTIWKFIGKL